MATYWSVKGKTCNTSYTKAANQEINRLLHDKYHINIFCGFNSLE